VNSNTHIANYLRAAQRSQHSASQLDFLHFIVRFSQSFSGGRQVSGPAFDLPVFEVREYRTPVLEFHR
jgi:hypothetical protein